MAPQSSWKIQTLKKEYSLHKKTVSDHVQCQALKDFDYKVNKADQTDRKACYDAVHCLKKKSE